MNKLYILIFCLIALCIFLNSTIENYTDTPIPAIILMRHGEEYSMKGNDIPQNKPTKDYPFKDDNNTSTDDIITLSSNEQTLSYSKPYGVPGAKTLFQRLKSKLSPKYANITKIITISPEKSNGQYPTKNPFLTAYYYTYGENGEFTDLSKIKNISDVKEFELIDSKANGAGSDGQNSPTIQPSELVKYINDHKTSVLVIGTRDTIWGPSGTNDPATDSLLYKFKQMFKLNLKEAGNVAVLPSKGQTAYVLSELNGTSGTFKILEVI